MKLNTRPDRLPTNLDAELHNLEQRIEESAPDLARSIYDREYFPLICLQLALQAEVVPQRRLAFIPIGTQPYSPILATLANPARRTVYLYTEGSQAQLQTVLQSVSVRDAAAHDIGEVEDPAGILPIVESELALCGRPGAEQVSVDVTSGRKATVAVLGSIAAALGFQQTYILSDPFERHPTLHRSGRLVLLPNVRGFWSLPERSMALSLLESGAFLGAERIFRVLAAASAESALDHAMVLCCAAFREWLKKEAPASTRLFEKAANRADEKLAKVIRKAAERAAKDASLGWPAAERDARVLGLGGGTGAKAGPIASAKEIVREVA